MVSVILDAAQHEVDSCDWDAAHCREWLKHAGRAMMLGIRQATRRYKYGYKCLDLFNAIENAVKPYALHVDYEGQKYILRYNVQECTATCEEYFPDEDY